MVVFREKYNKSWNFTYMARNPLILQINWIRKKGEILDKIEQKPDITQGQFSKNITFFMRGTLSLFCCLLSKIRTKGEISDIIWANNPYTTATIFTKCNVFYASHMAETWVFTHKLKKNKRWYFRHNLSKQPL